MEEDRSFLAFVTFIAVLFAELIDWSFLSLSGFLFVWESREVSLLSLLVAIVAIIVIVLVALLSLLSFRCSLVSLAVGRWSPWSLFVGLIAELELHVDTPAARGCSYCQKSTKVFQSYWNSYWITQNLLDNLLDNFLLILACDVQNIKTFIIIAIFIVTTPFVLFTTLIVFKKLLSLSVSPLLLFWSNSCPSL